MDDKGVQSVTFHSLYPKKFVEESLKGAPGGVHIVLEGVHPNGQKIVTIGYRYSSRKTLMFVMSDQAGSTRPGEPYEMKYVDDCDNLGKFIPIYYLIIYIYISCIIFYSCLEVRKVDRPDVISKFLEIQM